MSGRVSHDMIQVGISAHSPASSFKAPSSLLMKHIGFRYARTLDDCLLSDRHLLCMNSGYGLMAVTGRTLIHIQGHKAVLIRGHAEKPFSTLHYTHAQLCITSASSHIPVTA